MSPEHSRAFPDLLRELLDERAFPNARLSADQSDFAGACACVAQKSGEFLELGLAF
jgi:hypothetical protein